MAKIIKEFKISLYLDTRRKKKSGKYPVKLRIYSTHTEKRKLLPTKFEMTESEFKQTWESSKTPVKYQEDKLKLQTIENYAHEVADTLSVFDLDEFERAFYGSQKSNKTFDVNYYYAKAIEDFENNNKHGSASTYDSSLKSLMKFNKGKPLNFYSINSSWLKKYENFMINDLENSQTTVGIYLRSLRAIFNNAINDKTINKDIYPFGKRKYRIPKSKGVKKALNSEELLKLFNSKPKTKNQEIAKDFWFFAYGCNGLNVKDIAYLKYKDLSEDRLRFVRAKTASTVSELEPVEIFLNEYTTSIINKYGTTPRKNNNYIFSIINPGDDAKKARLKIQIFTKMINDNIKPLAKTVNVNSEISFIWARHTFATTAIRKGATMAFVGAQMSHTNPNTTKSYFAGFEDKPKKEIADKLFDFNS